MLQRARTTNESSYRPTDPAREDTDVPGDEAEAAATSDAEGPGDTDPAETREWLDSLEDILYRWGPERVRYLMAQLEERAATRGVPLPFRTLTPQVNTIPPEQEPEYPGDLELEIRIENLCRWNAMAMVVRANEENDGLGGHLATYASSATLYEVGFNYLFRARNDEQLGDQVFIQGHGSPGIYARAFLEGRLSEEQLLRFRQELIGGLPSYPHPWLMPEFWQFPTVSMGLGPLMAIYQARFNRYLEHRGVLDTSASTVWCYCGDGEMDEPESRGAIDIAAREKLDNLVFVINCNLQRLDGPVRGNSSIVQELEGAFRGSGWNVIKVLWSREWDELFAADEEGHLARHLAQVVDGDLQRLGAGGGRALREELFGTPELARLIEGWSDEKVERLRWGGHDATKVYAAYRAAMEHEGAPTLILAQTVKGWGMGKTGQGANSAHQLKKIKGDGRIDFRDRFHLALSDEEAKRLEFARASDDGREVEYVKSRRAALGGPFPNGLAHAPALDVPGLDALGEFLGGSNGRPVSTTMGVVKLIGDLMDHKTLGERIVPIIPDEARTFGMEAFFRKYGIYAPGGQAYEPVDRKTVLYYREEHDGQLLEEGITEAGAMSSFIAAGTTGGTHGLHMVPFYLFYSMFGFQRIADLIWAAGDMRCRGFLLGCTAGRTTLNGEGLQHEDGHSLLLASPFPTVKAYDPAYAYEAAVIVQDGLRRMYEADEPWIYYLTLYNENVIMPALPGDEVVQGILDGMYLLRRSARDGKRVQLFGSGPILPQVLAAAELLEERFGVAADVWSVTSYKQLRTDAMQAERWNRLHPDAEPRSCPLWDALREVEGPFVAASDYVALVPEQIAPWMPSRLWTLGTDGYGRSDTRARLRRHFEVDAESVTIMALHALAERGDLERGRVKQAIEDLGVDPDQPDSLFA